VVGDGGFGHAWAEMETAVRSDIRITVVVLNNGVLGYQKDAEKVKFGRYTSSGHLRQVDHALIARAVGPMAVALRMLAISMRRWPKRRPLGRLACSTSSRIPARIRQCHCTMARSTEWRVIGSFRIRCRSWSSPSKLDRVALTDSSRHYRRDA